MKFLLMLWMSLIVGSVHAQSNTELPKGFVTVDQQILCGPADTVFRGLASAEINEKPQWVGTTENGSHVAVFVNQHTSAFTVVQFGEQMLCILSLGQSSHFFIKK
jgi:hypothetical protein